MIRSCDFAALAAMPKSGMVPSNVKNTLIGKKFVWAFTKNQTFYACRELQDKNTYFSGNNANWKDWQQVPPEKIEIY